MNRKDFNMDTHLLEDVDREELGRLVADGNTSGKLVNGEGLNIYWELNLNIWKD